MLTLARRTDRTRTPARRRRPGVALAVSLAVNAGVIALFFHAASQGYSLVDLFRGERSAEVRAERIGFVQLPKPTPVEQRDGGDGRPRTAEPRDRAVPAAPRPVAPSSVPTALPPVDPAAPATGGGGSGPVVGAGGATEGIRPQYTDPRLWTRPEAAVATAPRGARELGKYIADSVIADRLGYARDSILAAQELAAGQRRPGDWTASGPGGKWGMDPNNIHLGKVKIPTALLGLLSSNLQRNLRGNPTEMANERRLAEVRADLMQHAQREMNEDEFRRAVREIRTRKDRERQQRLAEKRAKGQLPGQGESGGTAGGAPDR